MTGAESVLLSIGRAAEQPRPAETLPPFRLPAEHFAAGVAWLALGAGGLILVAPDLAWGRFLDPRVVAVTHCFTLGWVASAIFGALYQIFPVALGVPARSVRVGHATFWVLVSGVATLVAGSWLWRPPLLAAGWILLALAVGGWSWNLLPQRRRARRGQAIGRCVLVGHVALGLAMGIVAARIGALLGWWQVERLGLLAAHAHLAGLGFATLTAIGVSSRLLPLFLISRDPLPAPLGWIGPLAGGGAGLLAAGQLTAWRPATLAGGMAAALGIGLFLAAARAWYRRRARPALDPALALVAVALVYLGLAALAGLALLAAPAPRLNWMAAYAVLGILGWLVLFVIGVSYRILPFLTWMHRFGPRVGEPGLPRVADLTVPELAWGSVLLLGAGVAVLAAGTATGHVVVARSGAVAFAGGVALVAAQHVRLALLRRPRSESSSEMKSHGGAAPELLDGRGAGAPAKI